MTELSELEMRILSELEELWNENVPAMMNTVMKTTGNMSEVAQIQEALRNLLRQDLIEMHLSSIPSGFVRQSSDEAADLIDGLSTHLNFVEESRYWTDDRMSGPPYFQIPVPEIVRTEKGREKGFELLDERGYQWWRNAV